LDSPRSPGVRRVLSSAVILAAILFLSIASLRPPTPKPSSAPATVFSAVRAIDTLHRILGSDVPHPIGSPANDDVRQRILDELTGLGYEPQVQTAFSCSNFGSCATVQNVVARIDGTKKDSEGTAETGGAVLLVAHYDSVPAGPGASDDGTGVATVLEIARVLKMFPAPRHSIILLLDEGEEAGLLGARAFVDSHPWAREVRAAVNLDARGTSGPSLMFETGTANDWTVRLYARNAARPATSSIFYTVYRQLPSDTDFTVFSAAGYQGLNFAYIGDEPQYHTPLDNSANVKLGSVQHHGENALPSVVALANADLSAPPNGEAVFFDVFERWVVHWPSRRTLPFAICAMVLLLAQVLWMLRNKRLALRELIWGLIGWLVTMVVTGGIAFIVMRLIHMAGATPVNWVAHPVPLEILTWLLAVTIVIVHAMLFARRANFWGLWAGVWIWWSVFAVAVSWQSPGMSYIVVIPAGVAALVGLVATIPRGGNGIGQTLGVLLPLQVVGIVGFSPLYLLYAALGTSGLVLISLTVALLLSPMAPFCADLRGIPGVRGLAFPWIPIVCTGLAMFATVVAPPYSAKAPERVNIEYWQDGDSGASQWIVQPNSGRLSEPVRLAANFRRAERGAFPWDPRAAFIADAPHLDLAPPTFTVLESTQGGGKRNYRALLRSERGAPYAAVLFPPDSQVESVRIEGQPLQPETDGVRQYFGGWSAYSCPAMPAAGIEVSFSVPTGKSFEVSAADQSYGLPVEGAFLLNSRPLTARQSQNGDVTIVSRRVQFFP
jgi:Peptidase family M28